MMNKAIRGYATLIALNEACTRRMAARFLPISIKNLSQSMKIKIWLALILLPPLQACHFFIRPATLIEEHVELCAVEQDNDWKDGRYLSLNGVAYYFQVSDRGSNNNPNSEYFWIEVSGGTVGRAAGKYAPPMMFNPKNTYIEMHEKKYPALNDIRISRQYRPGESAKIPVNLNVGEPLGTHFFIPFKMPTPSPRPGRDDYRLFAGTILIDGVEYELPVFKSCYIPSHIIRSSH